MVVVQVWPHAIDADWSVYCLLRSITIPRYCEPAFHDPCRWNDSLVSTSTAVRTRRGAHCCSQPGPVCHCRCVQVIGAGYLDRLQTRQGLVKADVAAAMVPYPAARIHWMKRATWAISEGLGLFSVTLWPVSISRFEPHETTGRALFLWHGAGPVDPIDAAPMIHGHPARRYMHKQRQPENFTPVDLHCCHVWQC